jgi:hypothetical protein
VLLFFISIAHFAHTRKSALSGIAALFFRFFVQLVKNAFFCKKNPSKILLFSLHLAKILK